MIVIVVFSLFLRPHECGAEMFELIEVNLNQFQGPGGRARFRDSLERGSSLARCVRDVVSARSARVADVALEELDNNCNNNRIILIIEHFQEVIIYNVRHNLKFW